jgi:5-formyltetrahydrofolate cyclo-ligase
MMLTKRKIRSKILLRLKTQKEESREIKSKAILIKLFRTLVFKKAKKVMFYISFDGEVDTTEMIEETRRLGKIVAVPACREKGIIYPTLLSRNMLLRKGPYGVAEPAVKRRIYLPKIDLVIVPGVAFDKRGNRLGRGKGCYDRFLKKIPARTPTLGLAFDFQILPSLPTTTHDVSVKKVICA